MQPMLFTMFAQAPAGGSYVLDVLLVLVLVGAALFAVCRSSRRT